MDFGYRVIRHTLDELEIYRVEPDGTPAIEGIQSEDVVNPDCTEAMGIEYLYSLQEVFGGSLMTMDGLHCLAVTWPRAVELPEEYQGFLPQTEY